MTHVTPRGAPPCPTPTAIASTLSLLNGSESTRLFAVSRELLPGCIRCAVVGNGGILNGSRQGQNIDAHDYVFRYVGQGPGRKQERSWVESWSPASPPAGGSIIGEGMGQGSSGLRQLSSCNRRQALCKQALKISEGVVG